MSDRIRLLISGGLVFTQFAVVIGYNIWYWLTLDAWQDKYQAAGYRISGSSGFMPDGSGVHRGGQFFPNLFLAALILLVVVILPLVCLVWWKPGADRSMAVKETG